MSISIRSYTIRENRRAEIATAVSLNGGLATPAKGGSCGRVAGCRSRVLGGSGRSNCAVVGVADLGPFGSTGWTGNR